MADCGGRVRFPFYVTAWDLFPRILLGGFICLLLWLLERDARPLSSVRIAIFLFGMFSGTGLDQLVSD